MDLRKPLWRNGQGRNATAGKGYSTHGAWSTGTRGLTEFLSVEAQRVGRADPCMAHGLWRTLRDTGRLVRHSSRNRQVSAPSNRRIRTDAISFRSKITEMTAVPGASLCRDRLPVRYTSAVPAADRGRCSVPLNVCLSRIRSGFDRHHAPLKIHPWAADPAAQRAVAGSRGLRRGRQSKADGATVTRTLMHSQNLPLLRNAASLLESGPSPPATGRLRRFSELALSTLRSRGARPNQSRSLSTRFVSS